MPCLVKNIYTNDTIQSRPGSLIQSTIPLFELVPLFRYSKFVFKKQLLPDTFNTCLLFSYDVHLIMILVMINTCNRVLGFIFLYQLKKEVVGDIVKHELRVASYELLVTS